MYKKNSSDQQPKPEKIKVPEIPVTPPEVQPGPEKEPPVILPPEIHPEQEPGRDLPPGPEIHPQEQTFSGEGFWLNKALFCKEYNADKNQRRY